MKEKKRMSVAKKKAEFEMRKAKTTAKRVLDKHASVQQLRREAHDKDLQMQELRMERDREANRCDVM